MKTVWKSVFGLWVIGICVAGGASAQAASGVGPYYAMPSWDQTLPASTRFIVLTNMNSDAVLDRETGLVWEKVPSSSVFGWFEATRHCMTSNTGGRAGWRLPTIQELFTVVDRSQSNPALPSGHPFTVPQSSFQWSATTCSICSNVANSNAWHVFLFNGDAGNFPKSNVVHAWCVRGGQGVDPQ